MTRPHRPTLAAVAIGTLAILLAGCSRHTALTVQADLVPFLGPSSTQTTWSYDAGSVAIELPPNTASPQAGTLVDLAKLGVPANAIANVEKLALDVAATVTPTSALAAGTVTFFIADASGTDVFQPSYQVGQANSSPLAAGQPSTVTASFTVDSQHHGAALTRVQSGSFRLGMELAASAPASGSAQVDVTRLLVSVSLPPGWGLP